jgi:hypothetical protein
MLIISIETVEMSVLAEFISACVPTSPLVCSEPSPLMILAY